MLNVRRGAWLVGSCALLLAGVVAAPAAAQVGLSARYVRDVAVETPTNPGDYRGKYGECYALVPYNPNTTFEPENQVGPGLAKQNPANYLVNGKAAQCVSGPDAFLQLVDFEVRTDNEPAKKCYNPPDNTVCEQEPFNANEAFIWHYCEPDPADPQCGRESWRVKPGVSQYNACLSRPNKDVFYNSVWDDETNGPLHLNLDIAKGGDATIAYYFVEGQGECRTMDYELSVWNAQGSSVEATGTIGDFKDGKYLVFKLENLPEPAAGLVNVVRLKLSPATTAAAGCAIGPNLVIGGAFIGGDICLPPPPPPALGCRFTGGLNDTHGGNYYTAGGQAGANTALQPQPKGEWTHTQHSGPKGRFTFHGGTASAPAGTEIDQITCSDAPGVFPSNASPARQLDFVGVGTFKNGAIAGANVVLGGSNKKFDGTYHWFEVNIDDAGEPGNTNPKKNPGDADATICPANGFGLNGDAPRVSASCSDFYRIRIYEGVPASAVTFNADGSIAHESLNRTTVIYEAQGYIDGGNLQLHPLTGFDRK